MKRKLNREQKSLLSNKIFDFGNIAAGALTFGTAVSGLTINLSTVFLGLAILFSAYAWALYIVKERE